MVGSRALSGFSIVNNDRVWFAWVVSSWVAVADLRIRMKPEDAFRWQNVTGERWMIVVALAK